MMAIALMMSVLTWANTDPKNPVKGLFFVVPQGESVFGLIYKPQEKSNVKVSIYNEAHRLVFTEWIFQSTGFSRPYNFSQLGYGKYTVEVVDKTGMRSEEIDYRAHSEKLVRIVRLKEESKFLCTLIGSRPEYITLNIYDNANRLLHTESSNLSGDFAKLYSLIGVQGGCVFEVIHQNGTVRRSEFP